ncbi:unnamed protein product [Protopolystoma xenopodis]|uniref:Dynein regulatory complex protein 10 n=1 Tax=Protopolystoma xenopodis TaxID=117903 RepID=A0A3S5BZ94_9PLAT|nr:unnamed protein product [Protopolystoma xenopodis]
MAIMEERRKVEEEAHAAEQESQALMTAATTIQAFWRAYKTRKMQRGKRGKKGGTKKSK